jgi:hypothetical protein
MTEFHDSERKLEQLLHRTLRELPMRKAPPTLETRVLREIERLASPSPSNFSFMSWPLAIRVAFVLLCIGMAYVITWSMSWSASKLMDVLSFIPSDWLVTLSAFAAAMYAALFALGAVAYRTLSIER